MEPETPSFNLTDSVQVGHNTVGPSTGDIVIQSGNNVERCSMCKTPIDASTNPGLYCFKEGCNMLFCTNCESFFRADRRPGEKPYCAEHIAEFVGAPIPPPPPGIQAAAPPSVSVNSPASQSSTRPTSVFVGQTTATPGGGQGASNQPTAGYVQSALTQSSVRQQNPYLNLKMVDPLTSLRRTLKSWNGEGRCQRSEFWWSALAWYFGFVFVGTAYVFMLAAATDPLANDGNGFLFGILGLSALFIILSIPVLSQQIRRLHDIGASGWWLLLGLFIPYIGGFIILVLSMLPSQPHPNKYG
jgi:uncharacterized membrane protein YhaH (DUF805 family)